MHSPGEPPTPWAAPDDRAPSPSSPSPSSPDPAARATAAQQPTGGHAAGQGALQGFVSPYASRQAPVRRGRAAREAVLAALGCAAVLLLVVVQLVGTLTRPATPSTGSAPGAPAQGRAPSAAGKPSPAATTPAPPSSRPPVAPRASWPLPDRCFDSTSPDDGKKDGKDEDEDYVARYHVQDGRLSYLVNGTADQCHARVWSVLAAVYPRDVMRSISTFVVYERGDSESTDALGYVDPDDGTRTGWELGLSLVGLSDQDLADLLTHELGHLLTLNGKQVFAASDGDRCDTYVTDGDCTRPGSLLDDYVDRTWGRALMVQYERLEDADEGPRYERALRTFHSRNREHFVSAYAATAPEEDFAETFSAWCLAGAPAAPRLSTPELVAKARFLSSRPELDGMRARCALLR